MSPLLPLRSDELTIEVEEKDGLVRLLWKGKSASREPATLLRPFFALVLERALARLSAVELHFEQLDHFNSSTVAEVIKLINDGREKGVALTFFYDRQRKWQVLSFSALERAIKPFESAGGAPVRIFAVGGA